MKKILFSLLLVFCCNIACAQKKSEVLDAVRKTVEEYFMPDFNEAVENSEWRVNGLASCSRVYIEPNHFFRNGKVCKSYADWVNLYCLQSLHGKIIEHAITLDENLQKVGGNNDLYCANATLLRSWAVEDGPSIPAEKIKITFLWRGRDKLVHIMHLDGDMSPIKLPETVEITAPQQTEQKINSVTVNSDYISDSSIIGYFFEELTEDIMKQRKKVFWCVIIFSTVMFVFAISSNGFKFQDISKFTTTLSACLSAVIIFIFFLFGLVNGGVIAYNIYKGKHVGSRVRSEVLRPYDAHKLAVPGQAIAVCKNDKWGLIDFNGKVVQPLEMDSISSFYGEWGLFYSQNRIALYNVNDNDTHEWFDDMTPIINGRALIKKYSNRNESFYNLMNLNADAEKLFTYLPYDYIDFHLDIYTEGSARYVAVKDKKYGIIDGQGNVIVTLEYDDISRFSEGRAVVKKTSGNTFLERGRNRKSGYIDMDGNLVIPMKYRYADRFSEGLAAVENDKYRVGYINRQGELVIPYRFIDGEEFKNGRAVVRANIYGGPYGVIDKKGNWILEPKFDNRYDIRIALKKIDNQ